MHFEFISAPDVSADGGIDREQGLDAACVEIDAVDDFLPRLVDGILFVSGKFERQTGPVLCAGRNRDAFGEFIAKTSADGVALILGNPETAVEIAKCVVGIVAEEKSSRDGQVRRADTIRIAGESTETFPVWKFQFAFNAVNVRFRESDWEANGGAQELIVVGIVIDATRESVGVKAELAEKTFGETSFVIISVGWLNGDVQHFVAKLRDGSGTGEQNIFAGRRLENAVVGRVEDQVQFRNGVRNGKTRT